MHQSPQKNGTSTSGWWLSHSSEKYEFVSWDEYSQSMEKQFHVPKHQPNIVGKHRWTGLHIIDIIPDHFLYSSLCQNGHRRAPLCCEWLNATCIINVCRIPMIPLKYQLSRQHVSIYSKIFWLKCPFGQLSTQQNRWMFELFQLLCKNSTGSRTENCWEHLGADWELMVKWPRWCQERYPKMNDEKKIIPQSHFHIPKFFWSPIHE